VKSTRRIKFRREDAKLFGRDLSRIMNGRLKFLRGRTTNFSWTIGSHQINGRVKERVLKHLVRLGGRIAIKSGSTRVVDLILEFWHFKIRGCGESCDEKARIVKF
jgi:hypothetical protein